ncbi:hypothetical protein halTADL_0334 [Halohasta litchfieldiae]|jgi:hypothetical protein|uniref:Uncharacterized protein n=1 Tax=Halohasta litchfieldiae TaxID=1073996 RepID=A0A1H6TWW1_9EURY|nr:hypothetical protein [Halohasta litchfieldiae]ATW87150.1 hypothetical protein halTADL_0334 [Halohasta litchfieldiae]SEI84568.1 hypothetical protein SAMN05444271_10973 [Halohasta litchfieldiae]
MARSDEEIVDEIVSDEVAPDESTTGSAATNTSDDGSTGRLAGLFSLKAFLLSAALIGVGVVGGGAIPLVGTLGSLGGLFVATFIIGLIASERRYLETALAGGGIVGASFAVSLLSTGVLPVGMDFFREYGLAFGGVGVALGVVVGLLGHYFGRDLRDGLTQEV